MSAIWKTNPGNRFVKPKWFATQKEAKAFCEGAGYDPTEHVHRVPIGNYLNPQQLVKFIAENFS